MGKKYRIGNACLFIEKGLFSSVCVDDIKMSGKKQNIVSHVEEIDENVDLDDPTLFLDHFYLGCTQRECKSNEIIVDEHRRMFESRISAGATDKLPGWENTSRKDGRVVLRHGRTCSKNALRYFELANKKPEPLYQISSPCLDDHHFKKEELESVGDFSKVCSQIVS